MPNPSPEIIEVNSQQMEELLDRAASNTLREEDTELIRQIFDSYVQLFQIVGDKNTTIARLRQVLFGDSPVPHHRFRLVDTEEGMVLPEAVEVHTVELTKYNLGDVESLSQATAIEQWAFFFLFADQYEPARLRELLPDREFQQAVSVIEAIASKTEDREMYDQREKAQRDYLSAIEGARREGLEAGREEGREVGCEVGLLAGKIQLIQQLLDEESSSTESLLNSSTEELSSMLSNLQQRLRSRGG